MFADKSHKTFTTVVVVATTAAIVFYSEQAFAYSKSAGTHSGGDTHLLSGAGVRPSVYR